MDKLIDAALEKDLKAMEKCLNDGADINIRHTDGKTALIIAAYHKQVNMVKFLIEHQAHVNLQDDKGQTSLHFSLLFGSYSDEIAKLLIQAGADTNVINSYDSAPLLYASLIGCLDTVKLLVKNGANPKFIRKEWNETALSIAANEGHLNVVKYLVNLTDEADKQRAYEAAKSNSQIEVISYFEQLFLDSISETEEAEIITL